MGTGNIAGKTTWNATVPENAAYARAAFPTAMQKTVKVEYGNKATDWSLSPEDTEAATGKAQATADDAVDKIVAAETVIQQLSDAISMLVVDENGGTLFEQDPESWSFSFHDVAENLSGVSGALNDLSESSGDTAATVKTLREIVETSDLENIGNYVKITEIENTDGTKQPCIELGNSGNFSVLITNTEIRFMDGANKVAYISNQALNIKKAIIEDEMQIGDFVWKARANGNMGLSWKGVES
jgi:hypothetical protein